MTSKSLTNNRARILAELKQLVAFPSVSAQPQHKRDLFACAE